MLRDGFESYHFKKRRNAGGTLLLLLKILLITVILYAFVVSIFLNPLRIGSISMSPTISEHDRILASPLFYGVRVPFAIKPLLEFSKPRRGDLVVFSPPYLPKMNMLQAIFDALIRFLTLQRYSLVGDSTGARVDRNAVKRIIGVPGDTVRLERFVAFVRPKDADSFERESELISTQYDIQIDRSIDDWPQDLPLSGNMQELELGEGQYFVLGDNRCHSSDSRSWGPITESMVRGRVFFRYWPIDGIGRL
jgi:signal peptidase I